MNCLNCGKEIKITFRKEPKYCSHECCIKYHAKRQNEKRKRTRKKEQKFCIVCGKELIGRKRAYCSEECNRQAINEKQSEYKRVVVPTGKKKKPKLTIAQINELARKEGLNYGQYCAKHGLYTEV